MENENFANSRAGRIAGAAQRYLTNVGATLAALALSPVYPRARLALSCLRSALRAPAVSLYSELRWEDLFDDTGSVTLGCISEYPGNASLAEIASFCRFIETYQLNHVFEIGTFDGRTTYNLARAVGPSGRVITLNLPEEDYAKEWIHSERKAKSGYRFHGTDVASRITEVFCDSRKFEPGAHEGQSSFIFIDGDHDAEPVASDSDLALRLLRPEGLSLMIWHDADFGTVQLGIWMFLERHGWEKRVYKLPCTNAAILFLRDRKPISPASFAESRRTA